MFKEDLTFFFSQSQKGQVRCAVTLFHGAFFLYMEVLARLISVPRYNFGV